MLAIISFALLGIWTSILGIFNNCDFESQKSANQNSKRLTQTPSPIRHRIEATESKAVVIQQPISEKRSEIAMAFRNLWNEILGGQ